MLQAGLGTEVHLDGTSSVRSFTFHQRTKRCFFQQQEFLNCAHDERPRDPLQTDGAAVLLLSPRDHIPRLPGALRV